MTEGAVGESIGRVSPAVAVAARKLGLDPVLTELLQRPTREVSVAIPVRMDDGRVRIFQGYRVQHGFAMGPCRGGVRFDRDADLDNIRLMAFWSNLKCALLGLPFGGAKGIVVCDPRALSREELARIAQAYIVAIADVIGPERDVLAPDLNTNEETMASMLEAYSAHVGHTENAVVTGKPLGLGGSLGRREATGRGVGIVTMWCLQRMGMPARETRVVIQGFGNVGSEAARYLHEQGLKVVGISDFSGALYNPSGIDIPEAYRHIAERNPLKKFKHGEWVSRHESILETECEVLIPAWTEDQLTAENASQVKAKLVVEGANASTTPDADNIFAKNGVVVAPDLFANAGGITIAYFEWLQNRAGVAWNEATIYQGLEEVMTRTTEAVENAATRFGVSRRTAAYIIALERMAASAAARGAVPQLSHASESPERTLGRGEKWKESKNFAPGAFWPWDLELPSGEKQAHSQWMGISSSPESEPPARTELETTVEQFDFARAQFDLARRNLLDALAATESDGSEDALLAVARSRVAGTTTDRLSEVGLAEHDIEVLIADGDHREVLERFARARQHLGLDTLEPSFQAYQRAIGGVGDEEQAGWDINKKRWLVKQLNGCARALCAFLTVGEHRGLLHLGSESATFQLRRQQPGVPKVGLGQALPLLGLSAALPPEKGITI